MVESDNNILDLSWSRPGQNELGSRLAIMKNGVWLPSVSLDCGRSHYVVGGASSADVMIKDSGMSDCHFAIGWNGIEFLVLPQQKCYILKSSRVSVAAPGKLHSISPGDSIKAGNPIVTFELRDGNDTNTELIATAEVHTNTTLNSLKLSPVEIERYQLTSSFKSSFSAKRIHFDIDNDSDNDADHKTQIKRLKPENEQQKQLIIAPPIKERTFSKLNLLVLPEVPLPTNNTVGSIPMFIVD